MANYALEGQKWGSSPFGTPGGNVTWAIGGSVPSYFVAELVSAFADWANYANITFTQVSTTASADIDFALGYIDGRANTLGVANYSYSGSTMLSAEITFDSAEGWDPAGSDVVSDDNFSLFIVALHEIGHAIGLDHYNSVPAVMNSYLNTSIVDLTQSDIDGVRAIYGAAGPSYILVQGGSGPDLLYADATRASQVLGFAGNDQLIGGSAGDVLRGGDGDDNLTGFGANDEIDGGSGFDYARYESSSSGVVVRLDGSIGAGADAQGDVFVSIEGLVGSAFGDMLVGSQIGNRLYGLGGGDALYGNDGDDALFGGDAEDHLNGGAGADLLDGGSGFDFARYDYASQGVTAGLDGRAGAGEAAGDAFVSVEGLVGSQFNDLLVGDAGANTIYGQGGNDDLYGAAGNDALVGGSGAANLTGGRGSDTLSGGYGDDNFRFNFTDLSPGDHDLITDFGFGAGDSDLLILPEGVTISSVDTAEGALFTFQLSSGTADLLVQHTSVASLSSHYLIA